MRHQKKTAKFGRLAAPRKAMLNNLAASVILFEHVTTTLPKAKVVRPIVERLITKGKVKSLQSKRELGKYLPDSKAVTKILNVLGPRYADRKGGYTRITKLGQRQGDAAPMARIEFV